MGRVIKSLTRDLEGNSIPPDSQHEVHADLVCMDADDVEHPREALSHPQSEPEEAITVQKAYNVVIGHRRLRVNSVEIIQKSEMIPKKSMMDIPLCKMVSLQVVRLALQIDIDKIKAHFIHGYQPRQQSSMSQPPTSLVSDDDRAA